MNRLMRRGHGIDAVSKWIGHSDPGVTFRRYWTDPAEQLLLDLDGEPPEAPRAPEAPTDTPTGTPSPSPSPPEEPACWWDQ